MPKQDAFRTDYEPGKLHAPTGRLLNKFSGIANSLQGTDSGILEHFGHFNSKSFPPQTLIGLAKITEDANTCAADTDNTGGFDAPCISRFFYKCKFRYFNFTTQAWVGGTTDDTEVNEYRLDASVHGAGQFYAAGEVVPAWADPLRGGWLVPLQPKERLVGKPVADIDQGSSGNVTIWLPDDLNIDNQTGDFAVTTNLLSCFALASDVVEDLWCECARVSGRWIVGPLEC